MNLQFCKWQNWQLRKNGKEIYDYSRIFNIKVSYLGFSSGWGSSRFFPTGFASASSFVTNSISASTFPWNV